MHKDYERDAQPPPTNYHVLGNYVSRSLGIAYGYYGVITEYKSTHYFISHTS
jgi:hypothetical protein